MREGHEHCDWEIKRLEAYRTEITQLKAEVERLTELLETHTSTCAECDHVREITNLQAENARLHKVVEAAQIAVAYLQTQPTIQHILVQALAELDKEGER